MTRRILTVPITGYALAQLMKQTRTYRIDAAVPEDAQCRGVAYDPYTDTITLFFEHESFPESEEGRMPPARNAMLTAIED